MTMTLRRLSCLVTIVLASAAQVACGQGDTVLTGEHFAPAHRMDAAQLRAHFGVDQLPRPSDEQAFTRSLERHRPKGAHASAGGYVILDVDVDETGVVRDVSVVGMPGAGSVPMAVRLKRNPATGEMEEHRLHPGTHPEFGPAAQNALREVRFTPALRDGRPVSFTLRMTVHFSPPAREKDDA